MNLEKSYPSKQLYASMSSPIPINPKAWQAQFDQHFRQRVDQLEEQYLDESSLTGVWEALKDYLLRPGKRLRPLMLVSGYALFSEEEPTGPVFSVASATELFHAFVLAHDDIIDDGDTRRGKPSLHRAIQSKLGCSLERAKHITLILGDVVFAAAMEALHSRDFSEAANRNSLSVFLKMARDTGMGACQELILSEKELSNVYVSSIQDTYYLKTTRYTFEVPLQIGAILGEAGAESLNWLSSFTRPIGMGFQMENDLHEIEAADPNDPDLGMDMASGIKTLLLKRYWDEASAGARRHLEGLLKQARSEAKVRLEILSLLGNSPAFPALKAEVERLFLEAERMLESAPLSARERGILASLLEFLMARRYHTRSSHLHSSSS